ncbi:MAG: hypothetical protein EBY24_05165 [Betaproteobacteria bacterium]|nr:hypothetical protein [Betaproteobacteria bacterium]
MKTPLAVSSTSAAGVVIQVYQALYGKAPGYADYSSYLTQASASNQVFANALVANFASTSDKALALLVLNNLGITATTVTQTGSYAALLGAVEQIFAAYGSAARGQIILNMTTLLAGLSSDVTFGVAATTYSSQVQANASYSATSTNTSASVVAVVTVPGAPTIGAATAGTAQASVAFSAPSSTGGASISAYTVSCVSGSSSKTGTGTSSPITISSLSNGSAYSCSVTATNSAGTSVASSAVSVTPAISSTDASSYAPANFTTILASTPSTALTLPAASSSFTTRGRYMIADASATPNYLSLGSKTTDSYGAVATTIGSASSYKDYLSKLVQVVVDSSDSTCYRIDAHLASNYTLDVDSSTATMYFRNNWGVTSSTTYGYVCFTYDGSTKLLTAKSRSVYNGGSTAYTHTTPTASGFAQAGYYLRYASSTGFTLVASSTDASRFNVYPSPINFDVPFDMNPRSSATSDNAPMPYGSSYFKASMNAAYFKTGVSQISSKYRSQISTDGSNATLGYNASTVAAQDAMLATIAATATANNFKLRYPLATYKVFRDAALQYVLNTDSVADGTVGAYTVPLVWFTNGKDSSGVYHPFMMVAAFSVPDMPHFLADIINPPGGGDLSVSICNNGYGLTETGKKNQCVTRGTAAQNFGFRVPLKDYGLTSALCDNTATASYYSDLYTTAKVGGASTTVTGSFCNTSATPASTIENFASISENGVMIDGTSIYPIMNNVLITSQEEPSLNQHGCHVGQGMGYHCHSDGFSMMNNKMSSYNDTDYVGRNHPPLIGFGFDGIALYGRYLSAYTSMVGYTASATLPVENPSITGYDLDGYGGHTHLIDGLSAYHYHSQPYAAKTLDTAAVGYKVHSLLTGAWKGKINSIPDFWEGTKPNSKGASSSLTD